MLSSAIAGLKSGRFVIVYDGKHREAEADLMLHASFATPKKIQLLRRDGGGLICFATSKEIGNEMGLRHLSEIFLQHSPTKKLVIKRTPYGDEPAFSVSLNHRGTYTGITDNDRSKTILELGRLIARNNGISAALQQQFYAPGHVPILIARDIAKRKGHTELAVRLCELAKLPPSMVICEMLGNGTALPLKDAKKYAEKNKIPFIEGAEILEG
ncbi:MAG: 3,4-dihydroxy-2-butanone-4-phosphate synthase [Candidatus Micrarchaeota archaeon]